MLGVCHFWWQVKSDIRQPLMYATGLTVLLGYRLWRQRKALLRVSAERFARPDAA
jgi:sulfoxide reductase heme-binding subunit YedZ